MHVLVVDALARGHGARRVTVDVIGAGPRAVAGLLEARGFDVDIIDYEQTLKNIYRILGSYDAVFVSIMSSDVEAAARLVGIARRKGFKKPFIVGGPGALEYGFLLRKGYRVAVIGEAEGVIDKAIELVFSENKDNALRTPGLAVMGRGGRIIYTGLARHPSREELNYMHSVKALEKHAYKAFARVYVEIVRGCSNFRRPRIRLADGRKCIYCDLCWSGPLSLRLDCPLGIPAGCGYCSVPYLFGPARSRDTDIIVEEVRGLVDMGVKRITLSAPDVLDYGRDLLVAPDPLTDPVNPPVNIDALEKLFKTLDNRVSEWSSGEVAVLLENIKASLVTEDVARLLGEYFGGTPVHIGVETGDEKHSLDLGRPATPRQSLEAVRILARHGLRPYVYFIYGLPGEDDHVIHKSIRVMREAYTAGAEKITVYRFTPLPGTAFSGFKKPRWKGDHPLLVEARRINEDAKKRLLGLTMRGVVGGYYKRGDVRGIIVYPFKHGPVILVPGIRGVEKGSIVDVVINGVISDRMVLGRLLGE